MLKIGDVEYAGQVVDGKANGRGIVVHNTCVFEWYLKNNVTNGISIMKTKMFSYYGNGKKVNGDSYDGEWKEGKREGRGIYEFANGDSYDGEWKEDKPEGRGIQRWADGDYYDGEWKEGRGIYKSANGDSYDGEWKEGKPEGRGIYKSKNSGIYDQEIKNGKIKSSMMHSNARIYKPPYDIEYNYIIMDLIRKK